MMPHAARVLLHALALAALVAVPWAGPRTKPLPIDASQQEFSAARAMRVVEAIAREPRPVGSGAHTAAREYLVGEIAALGLEPHEQRTESFHVAGNELVNVLARADGSDSTGVVLLMAHYDSVPRSPGAGDDAAGVACVLEALRAVRARGGPRNDIVLLLTDGEELGLLGARAFAADHPWAGEVRLVVNLDAVGNAGPAALFETGPDNGTVVHAIARGVRAPVGGSFAQAVYHAMPNDTDYSVFRDRGVPGANIALAGNGRAYHSAFDTPERLSLGGLQHMGEVTLDVLAEFSEFDLGSAQAAPRHFLVLPGGHVLHGPAAWTRPIGWIAAAFLMVAAVAAWQRARRAFGARVFHLLAALLLMVSTAAVSAAAAAGITAGMLHGSAAWSGSLEPPRFEYASLRLLLSVAAGSLLFFGLFDRCARRETGRRILALVPAVSAIAWGAALILLGRTLGDEGQPMVALAAMPIVLSVASYDPRAAPRPRKLRRLLRGTFLPALSIALVAQTLQGIHQVSTAGPVQETGLTAALVGMGLLLVSTWPAYVASTTGGRSTEDLRSTSGA